MFKYYIRVFSVRLQISQVVSLTPSHLGEKIPRWASTLSYLLEIALVLIGLAKAHGKGFWLVVFRGVLFPIHHDVDD